MWRDIPGFEGRYLISDDGRVRSTAGKDKTFRLHKSGFLDFVLYDNKRAYNFMVHRLVYKVFVADVPPRTKIYHKNGNKLDNRVDNLESIPLLSPPASKKTPVEKFWNNVQMDGENGCWRWIGKKNGVGYGSIAVGSKSVMAHRFSWELHNEQIPAGLVVMHKCDNPECTNPNHLQIGTQRENVHDAIRKGRFKGRINPDFITELAAPADETERKCWVCGEIKPIKSFVVTGYRRDGSCYRTRTCSSCRRKNKFKNSSDNVSTLT